ncbi:hypothetical protein PPRY_a3229 [Pseudoalteromonas prydzensis ACAM 620]|nr:hypothetical protein [Pseudoalteromonas prydzensis ACAM 620]
MRDGMNSPTFNCICAGCCVFFKNTHSYLLWGLCAIKNPD